MIIDLLEKEDTNYFDKNIFKVKTNAKKFKIRYDINDKLEGQFQNLGTTAIEGINIYYRFLNENKWHSLQALAIKKVSSINMERFGNLSSNEGYELIIYGPLLSNLSKLTLEIDDSEYAEVISNNSDRKILFAGGINSFGMGCTTVGMKFSNMICRDLNASKIEITYRRVDFLRKIHEFFDENPSIPKVDVCILEVDYIRQKDETIKLNLAEIVNTLLEYCDKVICWLCLPERKIYKKAIVIDQITTLITERSIEFLDFSYLYDEEHLDMCTITLNYINDSGNIYVYNELKEKICEVTGWTV